MSKVTNHVRARWRGRETGDELVWVSAADAAWLWRHGFYGVSPERDTRKTPIYGVLSLCEAHYLLMEAERGGLGEGARGGDCSFRLQDADDETRFYSSKTVLQTVRSQAKAALYHRMLVYARLRDFGWIVQCGLNYGADFLLYQKSLEGEHAAFAVVVRGLSRDKDGTEGEPVDDLTWQQVASLSRVATTARKRLVIAYVAAMGDGAADGQCSCRFLQVSRWNLGTKGKDEHDE